MFWYRIDKTWKTFFSYRLQRQEKKHCFVIDYRDIVKKHCFVTEYKDRTGKNLLQIEKIRQEHTDSLIVEIFISNYVL